MTDLAVRIGTLGRTQFPALTGMPTLVQHIASSANPAGIGIVGDNFKIRLPNPCLADRIRPAPTNYSSETTQLRFAVQRSEEVDLGAALGDAAHPALLLLAPLDLLGSQHARFLTASASLQTLVFARCGSISPRKIQHLTPIFP